MLIVLQVNVKSYAPINSITRKGSTVTVTIANDKIDLSLNSAGDIIKFGKWPVTKYSTDVSLYNTRPTASIKNPEKNDIDYEDGTPDGIASDFDKEKFTPDIIMTSERRRFLRSDDSSNPQQEEV